jgi:hypothetical protein
MLGRGIRAAPKGMWIAWAAAADEKWGVRSLLRADMVGAV